MRHRLTTVAVAVLVLAMVMAPLGLAVHAVDSRNQRRDRLAVQVETLREAQRAVTRATCIGRQQTYDGQFVTIRFVARELHATSSQTDQALTDLRKTLGKRPTCG